MQEKMANIEFLIAGNLCSLVFMVLSRISVCLLVFVHLRLFILSLFIEVFPGSPNATHISHSNY